MHALCFLADVMVCAERHGDALVLLEPALRAREPLPTRATLELYTVALAREVGRRRDAARVLRPLDAAYCARVLAEVDALCARAVEVLCELAVAEGADTELRLMCCTLAADASRWRCASVDLATERVRCTALYSEALALARTCVSPAHPTRLRAALHHGLFLHEQLGASEEASRVCLEAYHELLAMLDDVDEAEYAAAATWLDLLRSTASHFTSGV